MIHKPTLDELESRIKNNLLKYKGNEPTTAIVCWYGYLGALLEWGLLEVGDHNKLRELLPEIEDNPIVDIMLGN